MTNNKPPSIFNYDFNWPQSKKNKSKDMPKEECCEKYKKKKEERCKNCPEKIK